MTNHPSRGGTPGRHSRLVCQWAELLSALDEGLPSISTSADQMAEELPSELVEAVNTKLRERGASYQVDSSIRPTHEPGLKQTKTASVSSSKTSNHNSFINGHGVARSS